MKRATAALLLALALPVEAQHHQPYAGQQERDIKSLTADEVKRYLSGSGMGFAKPAELNRFPDRRTRSNWRTSSGSARGSAARSKR